MYKVRRRPTQTNIRHFKEMMGLVLSIFSSDTKQYLIIHICTCVYVCTCIFVISYAMFLGFSSDFLTIKENSLKYYHSFSDLFDMY